jgi:hypothetical protein
MHSHMKPFFTLMLLSVIGLTNSQAQAKRFTLQVESLNSQAPAQAMIQQLKAAGADAYYLKANVPGKGIYYRVRIGSFVDAATARESGEKLLHAHLIKEYFITRYEGGTTEEAETAVHEMAASTIAMTPLKPSVTVSRQAAPRMQGASTAHSPTPTSHSAAPSKGGIQFGDESGWEIYIAGGGSFWSHHDESLSLNDVLTVTPAPRVGGRLRNREFRVRQSFAPGGKLVLGVVTNINKQSALEFSYTYGTNNFKLTALEDIRLLGQTLAPDGYSRSLGMRSHIGGFNYRHSLVNNEHARFYLTGGFNFTVFQPTNDGLDQLFGLGPNSASDFKQKPNFKTVVAPGVNFGVGVIVKATDTVGFRIDVRDYMTFTKRVKGSAELTSGEKLEVNLFGKTLHNLVPTFGVVFTPQ